MPRPNTNTDRDRQIAAKARLGQSHDQLAKEYGLTRQRISQIVSAQNPRTAEESQRSEIAAILRKKHDELQRIIDSPPARTTAIGKTVVDPDSGETVRDMSVVVRAISEQLKIQQQYRQMFGTDIQTNPAPLYSMNERQLVMVAEIRAAEALRAQQGTLAPMAALPANYRDMTPAEQCAADLERRRAQLPPPRLEIIPGEIIG